MEARGHRPVTTHGKASMERENTLGAAKTGLYSLINRTIELDGREKNWYTPGAIPRQYGIYPRR